MVGGKLARRRSVGDYGPPNYFNFGNCDFMCQLGRNDLAFSQSKSKEQAEPCKTSDHFE
jgi:hypothetical protein